MAIGSIYESFLANQGLALFEYRGAGAFRAVGRRPRWCDDLWGRKARNGKAAALAKSSPFLENFLCEAEPFWQSPTAAGTLNSGTWVERTKSGSEVPLEASALFLDGNPILLLRNLSATFAAQQELFQTAREALLHHERLEREIQKKEILLHCIVHDLSQPLTAMRGCFDLLSVENLPVGVTRYVTIGHRESQRQEHMIRGILEAFAADLLASSAAHDDAHDPPDILACARQAIQAFAPAFEERGIRLQLDLPAEDSHPLPVAGDAAHIDRIFGNFLENALRYSPQGSTVTLGVRAEPDSAVLAFVDDQGPGLPADVPANQIFALFSRGKDRPGKAGLGLYFCKITVERWGGAVGAETRSPGGARFWFRVPGAPSAPRQAAQESGDTFTKEATHMQDDSGPLAAAAKKLRILVAEDTDVNRELLVELLDARGHSVVATVDGREALAQFEKHEFDVVILDQEMPRMNGMEAARAIRLAEFASAKKRAWIIGLSGNAGDEDKKNSLAAGM
ncbi:MAG: hybrid sensor histidine kinase/response regulator, partial [Candidatus Acidiferrales bacterium]